MANRREELEQSIGKSKGGGISSVLGYIGKAAAIGAGGMVSQNMTERVMEQLQYRREFKEAKAQGKDTHGMTGISMLDDENSTVGGLYRAFKGSKKRSKEEELIEKLTAEEKELKSLLSELKSTKGDEEKFYGKAFEGTLAKIAEAEEKLASLYFKAEAAKGESKVGRARNEKGQFVDAEGKTTSKPKKAKEDEAILQDFLTGMVEGISGGLQDAQAGIGAAGLSQSESLKPVLEDARDALVEIWVNTDEILKAVERVGGGGDEDQMKKMRAEEKALEESKKAIANAKASATKPSNVLNSMSAKPSAAPTASTGIMGIVENLLPMAGSLIAGKLMGGAAESGAEKLGEKGVEKLGAKGMAKAGAKTLGKSLLKKIPIIGLLAGAGFAIERAMNGDWEGAAMEAASGAAGTIPGVGTAASIGIDAALAAKDAGAFSKDKPEMTNKPAASPANNVEANNQALADAQEAKNAASQAKSAVNIVKSVTGNSSGGAESAPALLGAVRNQENTFARITERQFIGAVV